MLSKGSTLFKLINIEEKMKKIRILSLLLCIFTLVACGQKKRETECSAKEQSAMVLSRKDTKAVHELVNQFMTLAKDKKYAEAAAMLYEVDANDIDQKPQPLDNEGMQRIKMLLQIFPVYSYEVNSLKFKEAENNEVKCTISFSETGKTNWYFKPVRYLGNWRLCMRDSGMGDRSIDE